MEKDIKKWFPLFVLPTLAAFTIGFIIPFIQGLYLSFCNFTTVNDAEFVGLDNYIKIFTTPKLLGQFWYSFKFTALFTIASTILINLLALAIALLLTRGIKGTNIFRTTFFMPNLIGGIVLGYIWKTLLDGVFYRIARQTIDSNSTFGFIGLLVLMCWQQIGYMMIIYIAGLQTIPGDLLEAARIDGASSWVILSRIKLPMIMSSITICMFLTLTNSFKLYDQNLALTGGSPSVFINGQSVDTTKMLALNIVDTYYYGRGQFKGVGQAEAVIFFICVGALALLQLKFTRDKEVQH
jgi:raffinose/stachyose/melibiose transport system permease protein